MATTHLLSQLLPLESIKLGRLVLNVNTPNKNFVDPIESQSATLECAKDPHTDPKESFQFSKSSMPSPYRDISRLEHVKQNNPTSTSSAPGATAYDLVNPDTWLKNTCGQANVRKFLDQAVNNNSKVYLIVGLRTTNDQSVVKPIGGRKGKGVSFESPLSILPGGITSATTKDTHKGATRSSEDKNTEEQICAVLYQKVKFTWLSRKDVGNNAPESGNRWRPTCDRKGSQDSINGATLVEATLAELDGSDASGEEADSSNFRTGYLGGISSAVKGTTTAVPSIIPSVGISAPVSQLGHGLSKCQEVVTPNPGSLSSYLPGPPGIPKVGIPSISMPAIKIPSMLRVDRLIVNLVKSAIFKLLGLDYLFRLVLIGCVVLVSSILLLKWI